MLYKILQHDRVYQKLNLIVAIVESFTLLSLWTSRLHAVAVTLSAKLHVDIPDLFL